MSVCYNVFMNPKQWAKANKKALVAKIVGSVTSPDDGSRPIAVFAAGIPGAGKTEFLNRLLADVPNIVRIDLDEIVGLFDGYKPEEYYKYREAADILVDEAVIYCRQKRLDFVLDGTFGSKYAIKNIESALKRHDVVIFYVWKDPLLAWQHTKDRELVTKRGIQKEGFLESCINVPQNIKHIHDNMGVQVTINLIKKDLDTDKFELTNNRDEIDDVLSISYNKNDLERSLS